MHCCSCLNTAQDCTFSDGMTLLTLSLLMLNEDFLLILIILLFEVFSEVVCNVSLSRAIGDTLVLSTSTLFVFVAGASV